jgi:hypothetical protein
MKGIILALFAFVAINASAQDWSNDVYKQGDIYPGYMIDKAGKKTEGFIEMRNRYAMQNTILFYSDKNNKKSKLKIKSETLSEYSVAEKTWRCINYSGGLSKKTIKGNLLVEDGCISTYAFYTYESGVNTRLEGETSEMFANRKYPKTIVLHKVGDEKPVTEDYFLLGFVKKMAEYIAANEELAQKVLNKEKGYKLFSIDAIMDEYNEQCEE